ncbi:uncharacterized protein LOC131671874 [Phymastichus coffea]|uniref:uncharacterized protein LOC131671874 n=1 Tax=Phymastichus coffea TaxID=108790 RepID=UPI00273B118C|nr:uncharacterized protein LOC131671874 [Phymastichus coffea]
MAASESKPDESPGTTKIEDLHRCTEMPDKRPNECNTYNGLRVFFYLLSIAIFAATLITVTFVTIQHWINGHKSWSIYTLCLAVVPSSFLQMLSLRWYQSNGELKFHQWISHIFQFAVIHRFSTLLYSVFKSIKTKMNVEEKDRQLRLEIDAFTLNLFTTLLISVPQIILQVYIMAILQYLSFWTSASVITSLCSVTWALSAYALLTNRANQDKSQFTWSSMMIQGFWRGGMLAARIAALVLAAICFKTWILVTFGIHTLGVTVWIIQQPPNFCISTFEELAFKCLIGVVYFFDFFRLTDNRIRYNVCVFYSVMILQNATFYIVYLVSFKHLFPANVLIVSTVLILGGTFVGSASMLMHLCMFQNVKTIKLCKRACADPELSLKVSPSKSISRSPKKLNNHNAANDSVESIVPDITADKTSLLTNIVQNTESMEKGILNTSFMKNDETNVTVQVVVEDNKVTNVDVSIEKLQNQSTVDKDSCSIDISIEKLDSIMNTNTDSLHRQKRRGICSEVELDLKPDEMCTFELETQLCSQKRRGICSLTQLGLELITDEDNYVEKSFSSLDKLKSNSELPIDIPDKSIDTGILDLPIKSLITDNNCDLIIPESILVRGRLSTPAISESDDTAVTAQLSDKSEESQKQLEEETMSHVTSIHDYENLCPLGVARPPWFIRSWQGYTDIETYIHDDSVVRDRRRDTLTSTATGTTASSDFSDATYASLKKIVKRSRQDDYLDTLIYDLVDWESLSNKALVEESSTMTSESTDDSHSQDQTNLFCAKPIVIDEKGGMLALDTILEEREDHSSFPELRMAFNNSSNTCSVSSLVATIDEIRKCTAENSPRHVYHRTESQWEDLEQKQALLMKQARLTKVLFANDYSNVTFTYSDPWAGSLVSDRNNDKLNFIREMTKYCLKDSSGTTPLINAILSDSPILNPKADTQNCVSHEVIEEDNVYVDMNALGAQKCSSESHANQTNSSQETKKDVLTQVNLDMKNNMDNEVTEKKVAFTLTTEIINDAIETCSEKSDTSSNKNSDTTKTPFSIDKRRRAINRPRRKFSILRERFEPKLNDQLVSMVAPPLHNKINSNRQQLNSLNKRISVIFNDQDVFDSSLNYDKQNLTAKSSPSVVDSKNKLSDTFKEKRSIFLKQVLSPPRFQGWGRKRTFSPNAKIISKAR